MRKRTALVTGASSGIGAALARRLARDGYELWLAARRADRLDALAGEITDGGGQAHPVVLDVLHADATAAEVVKLDDACGGLDLVIANAGIHGIVRAKRLTWDFARDTLMTNLVGAAATIVPLVPRMIERGSGHIVGISSLAAEVAFPMGSQYCAAKSGLTAMLTALRPDLARRGVHVTVVHSGFIKTALTAPATFKMPFLMDLDPAADRIMAGIRRKEAVVRFPFPMTLAPSLFACLPRPLRDWVMVRARM